MAKHRRQETNTATRTVAAATAAIAGATIMAPAAGAVEVRVPNTPIAAEVPSIDQLVPNLENLGAAPEVRAAVDAARALPVANVAPVNEFLNNVEAQIAPAPAQAQGYSAPAPAPAVNKGQQILEIAQSKVGAPYVYGAAGPNAFDCSGFTSWVYSQAGISIPRTSQAQAYGGQRVAISDLQPGDIVVYYGGASHVAIYAGNGQIIDALNSGIPVGYRDLHMMPIHSAVRF